ncbi:MAG: bifunctional (p)ppGpp synthetase/guanosine-3',5'-bis(diphosphate) 3'-pyrophosphohydrolase [Chlorobi bacterium]|nr:bifunctional (p)ppGpp synthetase/guanosine-3',5'-bis(diphosphate) 3'-pyrophosphohydrolase [Chlorobiota bacterium]
MPTKKNKAETERLEILRKYRRLIEVWHTRKETSDRWMVRKAFKVAADAHRDMRRKTGEPFIYHPLEVATIAAGEIGLGRTSIISALLHDTVEDTDMTVKDIELMFDADVARIIDGLTKIEEISDSNTTAQAETLKKVILTLSDDVRVILIKLSDRLHNMRTMEIMPREKQMKIASETQYIYAPLANRLGLYKIKSELEDLSFRYLQSSLYNEIKGQIDKVSEDKSVLFNEFTQPLKEGFDSIGLKYMIRRNIHSVYSMWKKMERSELTIDDISDTEGIDIIIDSDPQTEKMNCWAAYSIITSIYRPNSKRLRDWISTPKANGYEAIHTTVMSKQGQWVDLHIRSKRMDEIASKGYAAHWKYKDGKPAELGLDDWLKRTRELLSEDNEETISFINDFQSNLFSDEILVFTPTGELKSLPMGSTVLDFAYSIHSDLGNHCLGATINHKLYPLHYVLKTGDQVKILNSKKVSPSPDWYKYVHTARSKSKIKQAIKNERKKYRAEGEEKLREIFSQLNIQYSKANLALLMQVQRLNSPLDLFYFVFHDKINIKDVKDSFSSGEGWSGWLRKNIKIPYLNLKPAVEKESPERSGGGDQNDKKNDDSPDKLQSPDYTVEKCCNPIPGDDVIGLFFPGEPIQIHRTGCGRATQLMTHYGKNIVKTKWKQKEGITFLASLKIKAVDKIGLLSKLTVVASNEMKVNIRNMYLRSSEGLTDISLSLYVPDTQSLKRLIKKLKKIKEVVKVVRVDNLDDLV